MAYEKIEHIRHEAKKIAGYNPGEDVNSDPDPKKKERYNRIIGKRVSEKKDSAERDSLYSQMTPEEKNEYNMYRTRRSMGALDGHEDDAAINSAGRSWADDWGFGDYDDGFDTGGYSPDQNEETERRETKREDLRDEEGDSTKSEDPETGNPEAGDEERAQPEDNPKTTDQPQEEPSLGEAREGSGGKKLPRGDYDDGFSEHSGYNLSKNAHDLERNAAKNALMDAGEKVALEEGVALAAGTSEFWIPVVAIILVVLLLIGLFVTLGKKYGAEGNDKKGTAVICLDPGHPPNGAGGEPELNLKVAKEVQAELESRGYTIIMTRTGSDAVGLSDRPNKCNATAANKGGADLFYSFHADGTPRSAGYPYQIYPKSSRTNIYSKSKKMASIIQSEVTKSINGVTDLKDGGTCAEGSCTALESLQVFTGANTYRIPAVLTEMAQLTGGGSTLDNDSNRRKLVIGIANGIEAAVPKEESTSNLSGNDIIDEAKKHIGVPYLWGGTTTSGFDCSGFTQYVYKHGASITIPRTSRIQYSNAQVKINNKSKLQPGDLVFFNNPISHVGIYIGKDKTKDGRNVSDAYIHSPRTGDSVKISSLSDRNDFTGGGRYE